MPAGRCKEILLDPNPLISEVPAGRRPRCGWQFNTCRKNPSGAYADTEPEFYDVTVCGQPAIKAAGSLHKVWSRRRDGNLNELGTPIEVVEFCGLGRRP